MYRKEILIDDRSYLELASRLVGASERLALTLRGQKSPTQTALASVLLTVEEAEQLEQMLAGWRAGIAPKPE